MRRARDPDEPTIRRASNAVGIQLTVAAAALVLVVVVAVFSYVLAHVDDGRFDHQATMDVGVADILVAGGVIGGISIVAAGVLSWLATRRAVRPLGRALHLQRTFVANASHELRTPLAVLDARLQYLQRHLPVDDPAAPTVAQLRTDAATLAQIVDDMLLSAEQAPDADGEPVAVEPIVGLAVESMRLLAADRDIRITLDSDGSVTSTLGIGAIHRSLIALLDNAVKYSPPGSTVAVRVAAEHGRVVISIADSGPGITGIEPGEVFDRFARGADSPHRPGGIGIGLALVRDTVERGGGTVVVARTGPSGTDMQLRLPRAKTV